MPAAPVAAAYYAWYADGGPSPTQIDYSKFDVIFCCEHPKLLGRLFIMMINDMHYSLRHPKQFL